MAGLGPFDKLPDLFFKSLRKQMLRGLLPSETVEEILSSLLEDYHELMPQLPLNLQADLENILKIYPEIAARRHIELKPSVIYVLDSIWESFKEALRTSFPRSSKPTHEQGGEDLTGAYIFHETQSLLGKARSNMPREGRSIITTDKGSPEALELRYEDHAEQLRFEAPELSRTIDIYLSGRFMLGLRPEEAGKGCFSLHTFLRIAGEIELSDEDMYIELREEHTS